MLPYGIKATKKGEQRFTAEKHWYLVFCKPRQEERAQLNLERQGYTTYLPKAPFKVNRRGRWIQTIQPLFPRYLFIHLDALSDNWMPIRSTYGVVSIIRFGDCPARVPHEVIETIQRHAGKPVDTFPRHGDKVWVLKGPMAGLEGIFLSSNGQERVTILLNWLGQQTPTQLPADHVSTLP
ncbi:MAG: transcription/translation regulatory transformer protein RfaH [Gammaproteobacteria bacterium]|nr:MAG: transcription/translation regulatory transformer protein RfaH [Gammaproteobacteria bacterium]